MLTRVLIADDHAMTAQGMDQLVRKINGFEVVATVTSGLAAIAKAKALKPDLMVLDYAMPDANGMEIFLEATHW